jgi:soluble lytic murein transglycosylase-like protein
LLLRTPAAAQEITFQQAVRETLSWASGITDTQRLDELYDQVERSAYRYGIIPEFALAVIAAEANYGSRISWARYDSWNFYEMTTGQKLKMHPPVTADLDTALSELRQIMSTSQTMDEVLRKYWSGPNGEFNKDTLDSYMEAVSKLWNGLEPFASERMAAESEDKYEPDYYNNGHNESAWASVVDGNLQGYRSSMSAMPELAAQLIEFDEEPAYANAVRSYNRHLSEAEAKVIARAILTYCKQTEWEVDPRLVMAVVRAESAFRPQAVSKVGALGLGQLMPATAKSMGIRDAFDPIQNLYGCVKYLERENYRWRGQDNKLDLIIASYNAGAGAVQKYNGVPPYRETKNFLVTVKRYYRELAPEKFQ